MQAALVDAIVRGERVTWLSIAVITSILLGLAAALGGHEKRRHPASVLLHYAIASALSVAALGAGLAFSIPRIEWKPASEPNLVVPSGESWRRLRGPAVQILLGGEPELAVPSVDAAERWVLFGLLSGEPLPGLPPADTTLPEPGAPRLCGNDAERCRAWPKAWPAPTTTALIGAFSWSNESPAFALAFDVESGLYLRGALGLEERGYAFDLAGRATSTGPSEGASALVVVRRIASGRLDAARILSTAKPGEAPTYLLERAHVSLDAGPTAYRFFARPLLCVSALSFPLALVSFLLAPLSRKTRSRVLSAARARIAPYAQALAVLAIGVAIAAPALVALVSVIAGR